MVYINKELEKSIHTIKELMKFYKYKDFMVEFRSLQTVLNYIDNSIPKEVIEKKIQELENSQAKVKNNKLIYSREDVFRFQIYILEELFEDFKELI